MFFQLIYKTLTVAKYNLVCFFLKELSVYGYPSIHSGGTLNKVVLINVTYDLLLNYRKSLEAHSEAADELKNFESSAARSQHLLSLAKVNYFINKQVYFF